jgi:hypothetical protein
VNGSTNDTPRSTSHNSFLPPVTSQFSVQGIQLLRKVHQSVKYKLPRDMSHVTTPNKFLHEFRHEMKIYQTSQLLIRGIIFTQENTSIQDVPGEKDNILGGHSMGHSKQKTLYEHVSYSERFPR